MISLLPQICAFLDDHENCYHSCIVLHCGHLRTSGIVAFKHLWWAGIWYLRINEISENDAENQGKHMSVREAERDNTPESRPAVCRVAKDEWEI